MSNESSDHLQESAAEAATTGTDSTPRIELSSRLARLAREEAASPEAAVEAETPVASSPESPARASSLPSFDDILSDEADDSSTDSPVPSPERPSPSPEAADSAPASSVVRAHAFSVPTRHKPWYQSRTSFAAKGPGGKPLVGGLGLTYTDPESGVIALNQVDLAFRARTVSAIVDPVGKRARALFLILSGLENPERGRVVAAPSRSWSARMAGRIGSVALISADTPLDPSLTVRQNILAPLAATGSVADWENLVGALEVADLRDLVDIPSHALSPVECFRTLVARAIVSGSEVFLVEYPSYLPEADHPSVASLLRALADAGCAVVVSTVDTAVAARTDRAIYLAGGTVTVDAISPTREALDEAVEAHPDDPALRLGPIPSALLLEDVDFEDVDGRALEEASADLLGASDEAELSPRDENEAGEDVEAPGLSVPSADASPADALASLNVPADVAESPADAPTSETSQEAPRTDTAMRGIPLVAPEDPALAEPEVSDLVVRARKILSDLPGSIAPKE